MSRAPAQPLASEIIALGGPTEPAHAERAPIPVEVDRVRSILLDDRREAGEARRGVAPLPLDTTSYRPSFGVLWRRFWRGRRRTALALFASFATAVACLGIAQLVLRTGALTRVAKWWQGGAEAGTPAAVASTATLASARAADGYAQAAESVDALRAVEEPRRALDAEPAALDVPDAAEAHVAAVAAPAAAPPDAPSLRHSLVRADALLQHPSQRAAREARAIYEGALPFAPRDAHGFAGLAEACLRLADATCARDAIGHALALRPMRSRYVALGKTIEAELAGR